MNQMSVDSEKIERAVRDILEAIGEDADREGLIDTPKRIARMYNEIFSGIREDAGKHLDVCFQADHHEELVLVKDIPFYSMCEHHLVPFYGTAHVGYIPRNGKITGLSKIARVVEGFAKRPQIQERLTSNIADVILDKLNPVGVIVIIEAEHMCMTMRGVKKPGTKTLTTSVRGVFENNTELRAEAMSLIAAKY